MRTDEKDRLLAEHVRAVMVEKGWTLSTAESCTSGRIASSLTSVSGASDYFLGGLIAYQNDIKITHLGVTSEMIERNDVVSKPVVEQMVRGACQFFHSDFALASTGYTGGGSDRVTSGTVWIGWGSENEVHSMVLTTDEGREENTAKAAVTVISQFLSSIEKA